jgi:enoyl-CoA hydratase
MMKKNYQVGDKTTYTRRFHASDVEAFADLSADDNPIHLDDGFAAATVFKRRVVHGVLTTSMFSKIFGTIYPGVGGIYLSQSAKFLRPVYIGDEVTAEVELIEFNPDKMTGLFSTKCFNEAGEIVVDGEAKIKLP